MEQNLKDANNDLKDFSKGRNVLEIEKRGETYQLQIQELDLTRDLIKRKINYYNALSAYLLNSKEYSK